MRFLIRILLVVLADLFLIASVHATEMISRRFSVNTSTIDTPTDNYNKNRTTNVLPEALAAAFNSPDKQISHPTISTESISLTYLNMKHMAGSINPGFSGDSGQATSAMIQSPFFWVQPNNGNIYLAETDYRIRKITASSGIISTFGGTGAYSSNSGELAGFYGPITSLGFTALGGIVGDAAGNFLYFTDESHIWKHNFATGIVSVIAGSGSRGFSGTNNPAVLSVVNYPYGLWLTTGNDLYFADSYNHRIRKISSSGSIISTVAGSGPGSFGGDTGQATSAMLAYPNAVYLDTTGKMFIADTNNNRIRVVSTSGIITTFAGTSSGPFTPDGAQATSTTLSQPKDVKGDSAGNIYYSDFSLVRMIDTSGIVATVFGTGSPGFSSGIVPRLSAMNHPYGIWLDSLSTIYFSDFNSIHRSVDGTPTSQPSRQPSIRPSSQPSSRPSRQPTQQPTAEPSTQPSSQPSTEPSDQPSTRPSSQPSVQPSIKPTQQPTAKPSTQPSSQPSTRPSSQPSGRPSEPPTTRPSSQPSLNPTGQPTCHPTGQPSCRPSSLPSTRPTKNPLGNQVASQVKVRLLNRVVNPQNYRPFNQVINRVVSHRLNRPIDRPINRQ
jgi:hypothetical protein